MTPITTHAAHPQPAPTRPDPARIFTLSGTLALNLLVFGLLLVPIALPPATTQAPEPRNPVIRSIPKPPEVVEVVPIPRPHPTTATAPVQRHRVAAPTHDTPPAITSDTGNVPAADTTGNDTAEPIGPDITTPPGPTPMQLAYLTAPAPIYPRAALRMQQEGTVLLRVLVDIHGQPLTVEIARSSGHRLLDDAARQQVLTRWRFQPASLDGRPVQAIGLVPVEFSLQR